MSLISSPRITVIVAVYNGASTIQQCLDSVARQTYPNRELIVMDGGSKDGTVQILAENASKLTFWQSEPDQGICDAWNKGLSHATGDWICFLGSDDYLWDDTVMERIEPYLREPVKARVVYGRVAVLNKLGQVSRYDGRPWHEARRSFFQTMTIPHTGLMHHRSLFAEHGIFDLSFRIAGDYDLLMRELRTGNAIHAPDVVTVGMRHGGVSHSPSSQGQLLKEFAGVRRKHGVRPQLLWSRVRLKMTICKWIVRLFGERAFRVGADWVRVTRRRPRVWTENADQ
jgi:glycosyltransferase involved in cell wall biosynthesis